MDVDTLNKEPRVSVLRVDTVKAREWLEAANVRNRPMSRSHVDRLAANMRSGDWMFTGDGVRFDRNGVLLDGQQRLEAITKSGVTLSMPVWFDLDPACRRVIDTGRQRDLVASLLFTADIEATQRMAGCAKAMMNPKRQTRVSRVNEVEFFLRHHEAIEWACGLHPKSIRRVSRSQVFGVLARASYTQDRARLEKFAPVLYDERNAEGEEDGAAVKLRHAMIFHDAPSIKNRRSLYDVIEWTLRRFLKRKDAKRLLRADRELFPLPEENEANPESPDVPAA